MFQSQLVTKVLQRNDTCDTSDKRKINFQWESNTAEIQFAKPIWHGKFATKVRKKNAQQSTVVIYSEMQTLIFQ